MKLTSIFLLLLLLITGCSDNNTEQLNQSSKTKPVTHTPLPAEPITEELLWETNNTDPEFSSEQAIQGGTFYTFMSSFPLTLRFVGPDSNSSFAHYIRANIYSLTGIHPTTLNPIPQLATHWAFGKDGQTIYYKLDPSAKWSDGVPVTADDYLFTLEFMRSPFIVAPWYNNYYSNRILDVKKHGKHLISVKAAVALPKNEMLAEYGIPPIPRHFHHLDKQWVQNYNWKTEPNTGPYQISSIKKGQYIEYKRKKHWWANQHRYYKNRFNPEKVRIKVIRDVQVAYKHFEKGNLDTFSLLLPQFWHEKAKGSLYQKGYIEKYQFYNNVPQPAMGMFLNTDDSILADRNVRYGIAHAMNFDRVIHSLLRGDYERLNTHHEGYGPYTNPSIKAREFNLQLANKYLNKAGWQQRNADGIRIKDGIPLNLRVTYSQAHHQNRLVLLKEEALKAGINLQLQLLDDSAAFKQILEKKHQIAWMGWSGGGLSPRYWQHYHSDNAHKPQTNNITNLDDPALDEMIMRYRSTTEKQQRINLAHQIEKTIHDSGVFIPSFKVPYTRSANWRWIKLPKHLGTRTTDNLFDVMSSSSGGLFWIDPQIKKQTKEAEKQGQAFSPVEVIDTTWKQ